MHSRYQHKEIEARWLKYWEERSLFHARISRSKKPYTIVIPPPNITGILHMGHALNNTIQDVLIRFMRIKGYASLWMPGTDHAGIATQNVVERQLAKEGRRRQDIGREAFLKLLWQWRNQYGSTIIEQLKKLGASCDWSRTRFTLDEEYSKAVKKVFCHLYEKGLIYRGQYIINWCPRCLTALSDEEAPYKEIDGALYYLRYPLKGRGLPLSHLVVATTRPETMLGDTAIAINPSDKRYVFLLKGKAEVGLPLVGRRLRIIADRLVEKDFGTGIVKVTPAHDKNDFFMARRHGLDFINIMNEDATLNAQAGRFCGLDRLAARQRIVEELKKEGLIEKIEPYKINAAHCYRCSTLIEPRLSRQWFVKMKPLAQPAIEAVKKGKIKFYPPRWEKVYLNWMENIEDWCISRQIWWGHRLPVYYCLDCQKKEEKEGIIVSEKDIKRCPYCGSRNIKQEEDVLDTWFSSWLWPFVTLGWPKKTKDFKFFYPTNTLVTASEILFFWVARMIMASLEFTGQIPFRDVLIHGTVRDERGIKMSKSLGNIIDPLEIIDKFGADALRFSLMLLAATGSDIYLSEEKFLVGRNFANKIWNASRYIIEKYPSGGITKKLKKKEYTLADKWIAFEFNQLLKKVNSFISSYRLNDASAALYEFFWHKFCDWYIEISKAELTSSKSYLLREVLRGFLKVLSPFMPFISEEIAEKLGSKKSLAFGPFPLPLKIADAKSARRFSLLQNLVISFRSFRKDLNLDKRQITLFITSASSQTKQLIEENTPWLKFLMRTAVVELGRPKEKLIESGGAHFSFGVRQSDISDLDIHREKIKARIEELEARLRSIEKKLTNRNFLARAPRAIVEKQKILKDSLEKEKARLAKIRWN